MKNIYLQYPNGARKALTFLFCSASPRKDAEMARWLAQKGFRATFFWSEKVIREACGDAAFPVAAFEGHEIALSAPVSSDARAELEKKFSVPVSGIICAEEEAPVFESAFAYTVSPEATGQTFLPYRAERLAPGFPMEELTDDLLSRYPKEIGWGGTVTALFVSCRDAADYAEGSAKRARLEQICDALSPALSTVGAAGIYACTLAAFSEYFRAFQALIKTEDNTFALNVSALPLWVRYGLDHAQQDVVEGCLEAGKAMDMTAGNANGFVPARTASDWPAASLFHPPAPSIPETLSGGAFTLAFPGGLRKALTLSYDDAHPTDRRLVRIFDAHGLRCSWNLNSGSYPEEWTEKQAESENPPIRQCEIAELYRKHEVTMHGKWHETWNVIPREGVLLDVWQCRTELEKLVQYPVIGSAYPCGRHSLNRDILCVLEACGIVYGRSCEGTKTFPLPQKFLDWLPTLHHDDSKFFEITEHFLSGTPAAEEDPWLYYVWGHSYEFDRKNNWERIEKFAALAGGHRDVWYATNLELYLYLTAARALRWNADHTRVINRSAIPVYGYQNGTLVCIPPTKPAL